MTEKNGPSKVPRKGFEERGARTHKKGPRWCAIPIIIRGYSGVDDGQFRSRRDAHNIRNRRPVPQRGALKHEMNFAFAGFLE